MPFAERLQSLCKQKGLPFEDRVLVTFFTALCCGKEDAVVATTQLGLAKGLPATAFREACIQGIAYAGFPRALAALDALADILPPGNGSPTKRLGNTVCMARGRQYFDSVYPGNGDKLLEKIRSLDPDFADLVLGFAYGSVLSRPGLPPRQRELMAVGALCCMGQLPQLFAHARGAIKFGASKAEVIETAKSTVLLFADAVLPDVVSELTNWLCSCE